MPHGITPAGQRLVAGRYAILGELGRGGIGVVWRAQDQVIGRQVALKELRIPPGLPRAEHDVFVQRVLREARTAGGLNDPAIVTVYDVVPEGGAMFIVMELIEAGTLADLLRQGPVTEQRAAELALQVLSALDAAHAAGIVHRDIKPSNIMLLSDGRVKLTDFGIAQATDDPGLTVTGGVMGSPGYMAPELFAGRPPSPATDLWALGATLFHLVEGRAPFQRGNTAATMHAIMYEQVSVQRCRGPLAAVITGLLVHEPENRLTAGQVRHLLGASGATGSTATASAGEATTEVMPRITDATARLDRDRTAMVDRDRTAMVDRNRTAHLGGTRPSPYEGPTEIIPATGGRRGRRRALWLSTAAALLVLALTGTAIALSGHGSSVAAPTVHPSDVAHTTSTTSAPMTTTTTLAPSTTTTAATTTTQTTTTQTTSATTTTSTPPPSYVALTRYYDSKTKAHLTAVPGSTIPSGFVAEKANLGRLFATSQPGTIKLYSCKASGSTDYFSSIDQSGACEGHGNIVIGVLGYLYKSPRAGSTHTLYRCLTKSSPAWHYDSSLPDCEGNGTLDHVEGYEP